MIEKYFSRLKELMKQNDEFEDDLADLNSFSGASEEDIERLKAVYPACPKLLLDMLRYVNGTYWRKTGKGSDTNAVAILASIDYEYPHYLLSTDQIIDGHKNDKSIKDMYGDDIIEWITIDKRIDPAVPEGEWLQFTNCINNGGTSRLYIDFSPASGGNAGQIIEYIHDPDEYNIIANNFDEYLSEIIKLDFPFITDS